MDDRQFDNRTAQDWIEMIEGDNNKVREKDLYPNLVDWLAAQNPQNILEIGCGQGICSDKINIENCHYVGIDPSIFLIKRANYLYQGSHKSFLLGNAYSLPFPNQAFCAAFSIAVWHLLEDKHKAAKELSRVLRDGGSFLIAAANPDLYESWIKTYVSFTKYGHKLEGKILRNDGTESIDILYLHTYDEIIDSLKKAHLEVRKVTTFRSVILLQGKKQND